MLQTYLRFRAEIAQQIADQLQAKLSPAEKAAIAERPTADLVAYAYYTKAKEIDVWSNWEGCGKKPRTKKWNCSKRRRSAIRTLPWPIALSRKRSRPISVTAAIPSTSS